MTQSYGDDIDDERRFELNLDMAKGHWSFAEDSELRREWLAKLSIHEISLLHNRERSVIIERMRVLRLL